MTLRSWIALLSLSLASACVSTRSSGPPSPPIGEAGSGCARATASHYRVVSSVEPPHRRLQATVEVTLDCLPEGGFRFFIHPAMHVESVHIDGARVPHEDAEQAHPTAKVARAVEIRYGGGRDRPAILEVRYSGKIRGVVDEIFELSSDLVELGTPAAWVPLLDPPQSFTSEIVVHGPTRYRFVSRGTLLGGLSMRSPPAAGLMYEDIEDTTWRDDAPGSDLPLIGTTNFRVYEAHEDGRSADVYYSTLPTTLAARFAETASTALAYFSDRFGPGPTDRIVLIYSPRAGRPYASDHVIVDSEENARPASTSTRAFESHVAQIGESLAREWMVGRGEPWIGESLAKYAARGFFKHRLGPSSTSSVASASVDPAVRRGLEMWTDLDRRFGRDRVDAFVRRIRRPGSGRAWTDEGLRAELLAEFGLEVQKRDRDPDQQDQGSQSEPGRPGGPHSKMRGLRSNFFVSLRQNGLALVRQQQHRSVAPDHSSDREDRNAEQAQKERRPTAARPQSTELDRDGDEQEPAEQDDGRGPG